MVSVKRRTIGVAALAFIVLGTREVRLARAHEPDAMEIALGSLIEAELAFARMSLEHGIRAAFLANFAHDGIVFEPTPIVLRDAWPARPAPADPKAVKLVWQPAQAGVARGGDLGFSTGPWTSTDARRPDDPARHGVFFSVWKRDRDGAWRVATDIGIATATAVDFVSLGEAPRPRFDGAANASLERNKLLAIESRSLDTATAYRALLSDDARLHRDGASPVAGKDAVATVVARAASRIEWIPFDARVARSADVAATYGQFRARGGSQPIDGYYVHLWLRDKAGRWRLAYDIAKPAS